VNRLKQLFPYAGLIAVSLVFWIALWSVGLLDGLEKEVMRWRYLARGELQSTAPIVFVDLDAETVSSIGDRPWDRMNFGLLLNALLGPGQAKAVGVDFIFSKFGKGSLLDVERARKGDLFLGEVLEHFGDRVVLACAYNGTYSKIADEMSELMLIRDGFNDPTVIPFPEAPTFPIIKEDSGRLGLANVDEALSGGAVPYWVPAFVEIEGARFSLHLMDGARMQSIDFMNDARVVAEGDQFKLVDKDGWETYRLPQYSKQRILTFGLEVFLAGHGLGPDAVTREEDALIISDGTQEFRKIPLTLSQSVEVNWFEGWQKNALAKHYSMKEVLSQAKALAQAREQNDDILVRELEQWFDGFEDKVIFVGPVDPQLKDIAPTPFERSPAPKVGLHANLYRTIQDEAYIRRISSAGTVVLMFVLTVLVACLTVWSGRGYALTRIGSLLVLVLYIVGVFYLFAALNWVLPIIAPVASALTASLFVVLLKLGSEEWQRRRIKSLFGAYVSPELVDRMVTSKDDPELGGAEAEVTAMFSDVEGFSALSELISPNELVALMNEYLSAMTDALQSEGGTLDKYIGDAIVTMFGMPLPLEDHAGRACLAALRMQQRHSELRKEWRESGRWPEAVTRMRTRIGINTGVAVVGNMGSRVRFNYTMMGDSVNLAARCESGAKAYGVYTMVAAPTLLAAQRTVTNLNYRKLDRIVVKGRTDSIEVYELWDTVVDLERAMACRERYEAGLDLYFVGNWAAALEKFKEAESYEPSQSFAPTTPSTVLAKRCQEFIEHGGPENWDGAYRMRTK
jgi:adenylate cyclase